MRLKEKARVEQSCYHFRCFVLQAGPGESRADQSVVVGPDRSIMVRHRIITRFLGGHSANSPPGKRRLISECRRNAARALVTRNSSKKAVTGVGSAYAARLLFSIESSRFRESFLF